MLLKIQTWLTKKLYEIRQKYWGQNCLSQDQTLDHFMIGYVVFTSIVKNFI